MAPPILSYEDLGLIQGEGWIFRNLDIFVGPRDRLALIGRNGAGKTTLLKCLAGLIETDEGTRKIVPGTKVVLLEQDPVMTGSERRRAAIVRALAQQPDVLMLDEPTNHLDLGAIDWLEQWLQRFKGAFIAISHDRTFLTRLTKSCLWLDRGSLRRAEIGFGGFEAWTDAVYAQEARA